jgi:hypothetical protein
MVSQCQYIVQISVDFSQHQWYITFMAQETFRQITQKDYENVDEGTKRSLMNAIHMGILRNSERNIYASIKMALQTEPGMSLGSMVVVCFHVDEDVTPQEIKDACRRNVPPSEVGTIVFPREGLAQYILRFQRPVKVPGKKKYVKQSPYKDAAKALMTPPPPEHVYMAVFAHGMCTVGCWEFSLETAMPPPEVVEAALPTPTPELPTQEVHLETHIPLC